MKTIILPILILLIASACSSVQKTGAVVKPPSIKNDSIEYQIIVMDPGFDHWYQLNFSQAKDYSNEVYRSRNQVGVNNWNAYFMQNLYPRVIEGTIDYDNSVDYGINVNRTLYWYLKYTEDRLHIRLLR